MLLLLFAGGGGVDLSDPITTPPAPGTGTVTQFPATSGAWRLSLEIAEPPGSTWYDLTPFYVGDRYQRGADDYKGKYRASIATVQLQVDAVVRDTFSVGPDILAPWGQDTTDLFGTNVRLGAGLLMRLSMVREVASVVVEWLPLWTGRVESWGDASAARGQIRTHTVTVIDTLADLTNVPVQLADSLDSDVYFTNLLEQASWPFGVDIYGDSTPVVIDDDSTVAAINRLDQIADPLGLVWRTLRSGRMVIHPAPWDTTHTERYDNPLLDVYPSGLTFSYAPDFTDIEYIADDDQQPFGISRSVVGILNSFVVTMPDTPDPLVYAVDDPVSSGRYGVRPFTATWIINNPPAVDDLLDSRAYAENQALPLRTTVDHEGFWTALARVDHLDLVSVVHADSEDGLVVSARGTVRNIVEERTVRDDGLLNWQSTLQIDLDSTESSAPLLPVEDLALESMSLSLGFVRAEFSWTNPTQPSITPTEVQYRVVGRSLVWVSKSYPGVGADGVLVNRLTPARSYRFQVRLLRRVDGVVTNYSVWREVVFTTPAPAAPIPVPDGTDTDGDFPQPDDPCDDFTVELQENDGTGWVTVDTFTDSELTDNGDGTFSLTTPIPNSFFNDGSMYRFRTSCDGVTWTNGPEFDPPADWTDPCPAPPALSAAPYDDAIVYVPKVCPGTEDADPDFVFSAMQIIEAVSGVEWVPGDALAEIQTGLADPDEHSLLAIDDPDWSDAPSGIVAYGETPTTVNVVRDKSISVRVNIADDVDCVLFECAAMRINCTGVAGQWRPSITVYETGSTVTLPGSTLLDLDTPYVILGSREYSTGDINIYVDGELDNTFAGSDNVETIHALPIGRVGAPPGSWITDCAVWDRVVDYTPTPEFPAITGQTWFRWEAIPAYVDRIGDVVARLDDIGGEVDLNGTGSARPAWGSTTTPSGLDAVRFDGVDDMMVNASEVWNFGTQTMHAFFLVNVDRTQTGIKTIWGWATTPNDDPGYRLFYDASTNRYRFVATDNSNIDRIDIECDASVSGWDLIILDDLGAASGASIQVYGGDSDSVGSYTSGATSLTRIALGGTPRTTPALFCRMDVAAVIGLEQEQDAGTETAIIDYLTARYL